MKYLTRTEELEPVVAAVTAAPLAAVDTEGDSLHHYEEKLCLVQVTAGDEDFVLDPLDGLNLDPVVRALEPKHLLFHGADFDLRMLKRFHGFAPREIFDTMLAAQLLGYPRQGYADLAALHCGVHLPKSSQKADWSQRPLNETLLTYAANDTHYLPVIAGKMREELVQKGRLSWHRETCARLVQMIQASRDTGRDPEEAWQIRGSKDLRGAAVTILKEFWQWRENEARRRDRPPFKVLNNDTMIDLARWVGEQPGRDVGEMPKAPRNVKGDLKDVLNRLARHAETQPQVRFTKKAPRHTLPRKPDEKSNKIFLALKADLQKIGAELGIQASLVATNADLEHISVLRHPRPQDLIRDGILMEWQAALLEEALRNAFK